MYIYSCGKIMQNPPHNLLVQIISWHRGYSQGGDSAGPQCAWLGSRRSCNFHRRHRPGPVPYLFWVSSSLKFRDVQTTDWLTLNLTVHCHCWQLPNTIDPPWSTNRHFCLYCKPIKIFVPPLNEKPVANRFCYPEAFGYSVIWSHPWLPKTHSLSFREGELTPGIFTSSPCLTRGARHVVPRVAAGAMINGLSWGIPRVFRDKSGWSTVEWWVYGIW